MLRDDRRPLVMLASLVTVALACLSYGSGVVQAASPAWKLLAVTGPSNLPPRQSEVQRLTVEAQGGTFTLTQQGVGGEGEVTPIFVEAALGLTSGSPVATIESVTGTGVIEPGDRVSMPLSYEETTIIACSSDCRTPGSTLELSQPATATENGALRQIYTKELAVGTGNFKVGEKVTQTRIQSFPFDYFPPGTTVTAVANGTITLSSPPFGYDKEEQAIELFTSGATRPLPFNAPAAEVQDALWAYLGDGSVTVAGGPGGDVTRPYFVSFAGANGNGPFADQDVAQLDPDTSALAGETANAHVFTTLPGGPGTGEIVVDPANVGGAPFQGLATLRIGPLPQGIRATGKAEGLGWKCPEADEGVAIVCTSSLSVRAIGAAESVRVPIEVESATATNSAVQISISSANGGSDVFQLPIVISESPAPFATRAFWAGAFDANGNLETQAGAHPFSAQTFFMLNTIRSKIGEIVPAGVIKNAEVDLPAGFGGNPLVTPRCPQQQLAVKVREGFPLCNKEMIVGNFGPIIDFLRQGAESFSFPIYNDVPHWGYPAQFTSRVATANQTLVASLRSDEDFGVRIAAPNIANLFKVFGSYAGLEGQPAGAGGKAFLVNPSNCAEAAAIPPVTNLRLETYELPGVVASSSVPIPAVSGCDKLRFEPGFSFRPSTSEGSSASGAVASLHLPQQGLADPGQLAPPALKKAVVTLPQGLNVNPSSANGLAACSEAQVGFVGRGASPNPTRFDKKPVSCPDASKLGTVRIATPLLEEELEGTIYLAEQEKNPFGTLLALYLVVESERFGLNVKLPGKVEPDPQTGQLTATFDNNPQIPFEDLTLNFRGGGPRSTLATPEVCGTYKTTGSLEPWSAPESGPPAQIEEAGFDVTRRCSSSVAARPFSPNVEVGATAVTAGAYSPLVINVSRKDGEQELRSLAFTLPKGLTGKLAGIPYCPESAIKQAERKSGKAEQISPSCPAASRIGTVDTSAGVGSEPIHVSGTVYLAGPYEGAPLSSVVITPAVAGPFDLGDVVIRAPLFVDPETTQVTAKSDPIPTILKGIPLKVRSVSINLDRPGFILSPTNCEPMSVTTSIAGSSGATAAPSNRFQVGGCRALKFKPKLKLSLKGPTKRTGIPALKAVVTYPKKGAYANIARAQVSLPHSEFFEQNNLDKTCTKPVLLEGRCPSRTIYGKAKAWTPLLDKPLEGPVYLVGGYGYKLPALVAELSGQIRVVLKGKVDTGPNHGIRNTFEAVPDAPVSRFVLELKGGKKYGLLVNSENLCKKPQRAIARFTAHNGLIHVTKPLIANQCGKKKGKGLKHKHKH